LALSLSGCSLLFPSDQSNNVDAGPPMPTALTGCAASSPHTAPGGYYTNGNTVCTADGMTHFFHGVDRPSLEWSSRGQNLSANDFLVMASWGANVVRVALNQDFWLSDSPLASAGYPALVDSVVGWAEAAGMDVILDLHWSDQGTLGSCDNSDGHGCQQLMADSNSKTFWSQVAARYKDDGRVLFELYNEPHDVPWPTWQNGGATSQGWTVVGMQQLYDTVRAAGADNVVIVGGLDWAFDLSGVPMYQINGYNIMYATHPYQDRPEQRWWPSFGTLTATYPVIISEFGDRSGSCSTTYDSDLIAYADLHAASWTAWGWFTGGCGFPGLIADWNGTPTTQGAVVKAALLGYAGISVDAGTPGIDAARHDDGGAAETGGGEGDGGDSDGAAAVDGGSGQ
jgi:hypothetical protein